MAQMPARSRTQRPTWMISDCLAMDAPSFMRPDRTCQQTRDRPRRLSGWHDERSFPVRGARPQVPSCLVPVHLHVDLETGAERTAKDGEPQLFSSSNSQRPRVQRGRALHDGASLRMLPFIRLTIAEARSMGEISPAPIQQRRDQGVRSSTVLMQPCLPAL